MWPLPGRPTAERTVPLARRGGGKRAKPKFGPIYAREPEGSRRCCLRVIETQETPALTPEAVGVPSCRFCAAPLRDTFVDLGMSPLCESYVPAERVERDGAVLPAPRARLCSSCLLVQLEEFVTAERHLHRVRRTSRRTPTPGSRTRATTWRWPSSASGSTPDSLVVELASNDGYLLQHFVERGIPALGIEPAANVAEVARASGASTTLVRVLRARARGASSPPRAGAPTCSSRNNVLAHVPDLNDFVAGIAIAARARRRGHDRVPAPAAARRGQPVRHDLPRALLVLLAPDGRRRSSRRTGSRSSTSRS